MGSNSLKLRGFTPSVPLKKDTIYPVLYLAYLPQKGHHIGGFTASVPLKKKHYI
jgi:hypothetical protein